MKFYEENNILLITFMIFERNSIFLNNFLLLNLKDEREREYILNLHFYFYL